MNNTVLFDLDNTLTDRAKSISVYADLFLESFPAVAQKWSAAELAKNIAYADNGGYVPHGSLHDSVYIAIASHLSKQLGDVDEVTIPKVQDHWRAHFPNCSVEMAGATTLLARLASDNVLVGIVSNGAESSRMNSVDALPFREFIEFVLSSETAGMKKPSPAIYQLAMETANTNSRQCCFVGDHPNNDVIGPEELGIKSIWLQGFHPWPLKTHPPHRVASTLPEVGEILNKMHVI